LKPQRVGQKVNIIGYKFGLLYGYGDELINVAGMSVFAGAYLGISWYRGEARRGVDPGRRYNCQF
jgi:hypothetical protein